MDTKIIEWLLRRERLNMVPLLIVVSYASQFVNHLDMLDEAS